MKDWQENEIVAGDTLVFVDTGGLQYLFRPHLCPFPPSPPGMHIISEMKGMRVWTPYHETEVFMEAGELVFVFKPDENVAEQVLQVQFLAQTKPFNVEVCIKGKSDDRDLYLTKYLKHIYSIIY